MTVALGYLAIALAFGWTAIQNGPSRFGRWHDTGGNIRYGGALSWIPAVSL